MKWIARVEPWLLPFHCRLCQATSDGLELCRACAGDLHFNVGACIRCAMPAPRAQQMCTRCAGRRRPMVNSVQTLYRYQYPLDLMIGALKYGRDRSAGRVLATLWAEQPPLWPTGALLLPVPLHPARERERGYNQVVELAKPWAKATGQALTTEVLSRVRATPAQRGLSLAERRRNLRGAFVVRDPQRIVGRFCVLIDDVITSGSTINELAKRLRQAGAAEVHACALARTL